MMLFIHVINVGKKTQANTQNETTQNANYSVRFRKVYIDNPNKFTTLFILYHLIAIVTEGPAHKCVITACSVVP